MNQTEEMKEKEQAEQEPNQRGQREIGMWMQILKGEKMGKEMEGGGLQQGKETQLVVERVGMIYIEGRGVERRKTYRRERCAHFTCAINVSMETAVETSTQIYARIQCWLGHALIRRIAIDTILKCVESIGTRGYVDMETDVTTYIQLMHHIQGQVMNRGMESIITINRVTDNMIGGRIRRSGIGTRESITI